MWKLFKCWMKIPRIYKRTFLISLDLYLIGFFILNGLGHLFSVNRFTLFVISLSALIVTAAVLYDFRKKK